MMSTMAPINRVEAIARLIDTHNFVSFDEIEQSTGLTMSEVIEVKPLLEDYMRRQKGGSQYITVTSRIDLDPPGLFIDD